MSTMRWPFQKLQNEGCSASTISPAVAQPQSTFVNAFCQNMEIDMLDPDQPIATPEQVSTNAIIAARTLLMELSGQETSQIDFYAEEPSEEQVVEARQSTRAGTDLMTRRRLSKHSNPQAQPILVLIKSSQI
ncbi:MAG: hypothetical protein EZS28_046652, partial [Streblomastix strix]